MPSRWSCVCVGLSVLSISPGLILSFSLCRFSETSDKKALEIHTHSGSPHQQLTARNLNLLTYNPQLLHPANPQPKAPSPGTLQPPKPTHPEEVCTKPGSCCPKSSAQRPSCVRQFTSLLADPLDGDSGERKGGFKP